MSDIREYLPSERFTSTALAIVIAAGLIVVAQYSTAPRAEESSLTTTTEPVDTDWQNTLYAIQGGNASTSLPAAPTEQDLQKELADVKTGNLTQTIGRSLVVSLANAKAQGLGDDAVSQDKIVDQVMQLAQEKPANTYSLNDLVIVSDSSTTLHAYGNAVMLIMQKHPGANMRDAMLAIGNAVDNNDPRELKKLPPIGKEYEAVAHDLLKTAAPRSLASFHILMVNGFVNIAAVFPDLQTLLTDPMRGLVAAQQFNLRLSEEGRLFTSLAQQLQKRSILFTKNEPGATWGLLLNTTAS